MKTRTLLDHASVGLPTWRHPVILRATARGPFVVASSRGGLVKQTCGLWYGGQLLRFAAMTKCDRFLHSVSIHKDTPGEFALCDYCALADELGPQGASASIVLARLRAARPEPERVSS